jgi:hypothetical protein
VHPRRRGRWQVVLAIAFSLALTVLVIHLSLG